MLQKEKKWYAVYTKPRWEKKINSILIKKGIESWCPLQKTERQWSDRKKVVEEPLFKSYVFIRINEAERLNVMMTDGVLNFVMYIGKPAIIRDEEIDAIKRYLSDAIANIEIISLEGFRENTMVKVVNGIFTDSDGIVIRSGKKKVYVQLKTLGQVMVVEFPADHLISLMQ